MSTKDVAQYFNRFTDEKLPTIGLEKLKIIWINDSSCVVKFQSEDLAKKAYFDNRLSEPRIDDKLPPLNLYLLDQQDLEMAEKKKKELNPDFDTLFSDGFGQEKKEEAKDGEKINLDVEVDERNFEVGVGFIDCMGYKIKVKEGDFRTKPWQNLWMRFATD